MREYHSLKITTTLMRVRETSPTKIVGPSDIYELCKDMADLAQEAVLVLTLNSKNRMIARHMVTLGLANECQLHSREIFRPAIADGAVQIVLVHNHPSGDSAPSGADIQITKRFVEAGRLLGIPLVDSVIIGRPHCISMRADGVVDFSNKETP